MPLKPIEKVQPLGLRLDLLAHVRPTRLKGVGWTLRCLFENAGNT